MDNADHEKQAKREGDSESESGSSLSSKRTFEDLRENSSSSEDEGQGDDRPNKRHLNQEFMSNMHDAKDHEQFRANKVAQENHHYRYAELSSEEINVMKLDLLYKISSTQRRRVPVAEDLHDRRLFGGAGGRAWTVDQSRGPSVWYADDAVRVDQWCQSAGVCQRKLPSVTASTQRVVCGRAPGREQIQPNPAGTVPAARIRRPSFAVDKTMHRSLLLGRFYSFGQFIAFERG